MTGWHAHAPADAVSRAADRAVRRTLLAVVAPLAVLTVVGLAALWPRDDLAIPPELGARPRSSTSRGSARGSGR
jgi:uncharacterized protein (DUF58 family)